MDVLHVVSLGFQWNPVKVPEGCYHDGQNISQAGRLHFLKVDGETYCTFKRKETSKIDGLGIRAHAHGRKSKCVLQNQATWGWGNNWPQSMVWKRHVCARAFPCCGPQKNNRRWSWYEDFLVPQDGLLRQGAVSSMEMSKFQAPCKSPPIKLTAQGISCKTPRVAEVPRVVSGGGCQARCWVRVVWAYAVLQGTAAQQTQW